MTQTMGRHVRTYLEHHKKEVWPPAMETAQRAILRALSGCNAIVFGDKVLTLYQAPIGPYKAVEVREVVR